MTRSNKRRHDNINRDYYEYRRHGYDQHLGNVYYIDQPPLHQPNYSQLQPPYYYAAQDGGPSALSLNTGIYPLRNSFYTKRPAVQVSDFEKYRVPGYGARKEKRKIKDSPYEKQKLSILHRISTGITIGLETFFYK